MNAPPSGTGPAEVEIAGLSHVYPGGRKALDDVTLRVAPGERFGIIGPSGAGKTTLMLHLNGILRPASGGVTVGGRPVLPPDLPLIRRWVGLVFQDPDDQLFTPTVGEDVAFGPRNMGLDEAEVMQRVHSALAMMDLDDTAGRSSHELSFGERRRVAIATVLAMSSRVVALDEPFSNLNPALVQRLIGILRELPATVIIISQSILPLLLSCDRLAVMDRGRIRAVGTTAEIAMNRELLAECGLDYTFYLDAYHRLVSGSGDRRA
ncbi:MAG TPA: ABC transporter ATP-binding protein [Longimicrobiales bacterium]|nr:ABC transporter ATP-binding protein [Longimicrobiales bacterium]